jgi:hypothetical protein
MVIDNKIEGKFDRFKTGRFKRKAVINSDRWDKNIKGYKCAKTITRLINKMGLQSLAEKTGYSTSYISCVERQDHPSEQFIFAIQRVAEQLNEKV